MSEPTVALPDHTQLPDKDGTFSESFHEAPQSSLLTASLLPHLKRLRPDGLFSVAAKAGIYWRYTQPPLEGCKAPAWFCVLGVPPLLDGQVRRSYVLWHEKVPPQLVVEYVYGDGRKERDATPNSGRFWVYERGIRAAYYAIFDTMRGTLNVYRLTDGAYRLEPATPHGRYSVEPLGVELGVWHGEHASDRTLWLRAWDARTGALLPSDDERAEAARQLADLVEKRLATERSIRRMEAQLRALGVDPDAS